jgi:hypothetical protein
MITKRDWPTGYNSFQDYDQFMKEQEAKAQAAKQEKPAPAVMTGWAAWHHTKGFDPYHYEGPIVYGDLNEELINDIDSLNEYETEKLWKAVKVEVRKVP